MIRQFVCKNQPIWTRQAFLLSGLSLIVLGLVWATQVSGAYNLRPNPDQTQLAYDQGLVQGLAQDLTQDHQDAPQENLQHDDAQSDNKNSASNKRTALLGVHVLHPYELDDAKRLLDLGDDAWHYVTVPFTLEDAEQLDKWQDFFDEARRKRVIPLVRLATRMQGEGWAKPERKDVVTKIEALSNLDWPTDQRHIIVYNEVNHAKEWGDQLDPEGYANLLRFTSSWARSEQKNYVVMPAAMDLAAPNGPVTMEAFTYLDQMLQADPTVFDYVDVWNSHAYPNPDFASPPDRVGQNSLRGFLHELDYLRQKTGRDYQVFITETGWEVGGVWLEQRLTDYYRYAFENIWSHPQVEAVTPFLLRGAPGPFVGFSLLDESAQPTAQYEALRSAWEWYQQ